MHGTPLAFKPSVVETDSFSLSKTQLHKREENKIQIRVVGEGVSKKWAFLI